MAVRTRLKETGFTGSRTFKKTGALSVKGYVSSREWVEDVTGEGDNQPFTVDRSVLSGGLINGVEKSNRTGFIWNDYPCGYMYDSYLTSPLAISNRPADGVLATSVIARTNPSRSSTEALEYLSELHTLGTQSEFEYKKRLERLRQSRHWKNWKTLRGAARANLIYQFGIAPLISDIETLMGFQKLVDGRVEEIERLRTRGLRRTINLWSGSEIHSVPSATIHSNGVLLHAKIEKVTTVNIKGHIRWRATSNWLKSDESVRAAVRKTLLGAVTDPAGVYELIPWSWLIDYFSNLGTMVKAVRNNFDAVHDVVRLSTHTRTVATSSNHDTHGSGIYTITCTPISSMSETKTRRLTNPSIGARIEFLQPAQWSILGSLAVLKI
jgi:hypothetical protein